MEHHQHLGEKKPRENVSFSSSSSTSSQNSPLIVVAEEVQEYVNQLVCECEILREQVMSLQQQLSVKSDELMKTKGQVILLQDEKLNLQDALEVCQSKYNDLFSLLEEQQQQQANNLSISLDSLEFGNKNYDLELEKQHPMDSSKHFNLDSSQHSMDSNKIQLPECQLPSQFSASSIELSQNSTTTTYSTPVISSKGTMIGLLNDLEMKLSEQKRDFDLEKNEMLAKSRALSQTIIQLEEEKAQLFQQLELERFKKCSNGLFSVKAQVERKDENPLSTSSQRFTSNSLSNAILTLMDRLKETDPVLLSQKLAQPITSEQIMRFSDSMIDSVKWELKNLLMERQGNSQISSKEASVIYLLMEEVCGVKKILNHFSKDYIVRMQEQSERNSSFSQLKRVNETSKRSGIMRFFFE